MKPVTSYDSQQLNFVSVEVTMFEPMPQAKRSKLFLGGNMDQHIGWVSVYNGVNVIEYIVDKEDIRGRDHFIILSIGNALKEEFFGAFDRTRHKLPY